MNLLIISNFEAPYRVEFYNEISKYCNLTVLFSDLKEQQTERDKNWFSNIEYKFTDIHLKQTKVFKNHICFGVKKHIKDKKYDFIIVDIYSTLTAMFSIWYMNRNKIPFILSVDGGLVKTGRGIKESLKKYLIGSASYYLSTGYQTDKYLMFYGADRSKISHYPITTLKANDLLNKPLTKEEKEHYKNQLGISCEKMVLTVGQFIYRKGIDVLINASKNLDENTGVYIIGGEPTPEFIKLIDDLKLNNVYFLPFMNKDELSKYFKASDLFVFPTREDIWGLVVNEAMAFGLPVISSDNCVAGLELIENEINGYITPVGDIDDLNAKITLLINDELLREKMSFNNLSKIQWYTIENEAKVHIDNLKKM